MLKASVSCISALLHPLSGQVFSFPFTSENANPHRLSFEDTQLESSIALSRSIVEGLTVECCKNGILDAILYLFSSSNLDSNTLILCLSVSYYFML